MILFFTHAFKKTFSYRLWLGRFTILALACLFAQNVGANESSKKIQDNSFLLEEAYNQDESVVQHIQTFLYSKDDSGWQYGLTQEWPLFSQKHQVSYTIPYAKTDPDSGFGDIAFHYRYQAYNQERLAIAPRLSVLTPTGDHSKGLGTDTFGAQINLPVSYEWSADFVSHLNLGWTFIPNAKNIDGETETFAEVNCGASLVWLSSETFNVMLELAGSVFEESKFYINPGVRYAINFESGLQLVPGFAIPFGVGPNVSSLNFLGYFSMEHGF